MQIETIDSAGRFDAYVAEPEGRPTAAIVVIQEIFGVNRGIRAKCDRLASEGYLAIAPDLFWRIEPGIQLDPDIEQEMQRGLTLMGQFDQDQAIRDIEATIRAVRARLPEGG
jgi:carboxymethylenebutenolidase